MTTSVLASWLLSIAACGQVRGEVPGPAARPQTLTVEVRDLGTDAPVPGASLKLNVAGGEPLQASTDAKGLARFEYALPEAIGRRRFSIAMRRDGLVPLAARWIHESSSATPPDRLLFRTEKATTIRGRVVDEEDRPLADAVVVVSVKKSYPGTQQWVDVRYESTRTDATGLWSFRNVPEQPDSVEIATYHPLCLTEHASFFPEPFKPLAALRDGSATLRLRHGTRIEGAVLAPDGRPVADAEVFHGEGRYGNSIPPVKTDARGRYALGFKPGTDVTLTAKAKGFGPTRRRSKVGESPLRVDLTLEPAHSFRGQVVDPAGAPIAHADVWVYWSGPEAAVRSLFGSAISHRMTTGEDGRFEWKDAPGRGVHVSVSAEGFAGKEAQVLASDVDHDIVLSPPTAVSGTVVDRETGQSLPRFSLTVAAAWNPGDPLIWQGGSRLDATARKAPGSFAYTTSAQAHRYLLRVQAEGYLPEDSDPFPTDGSAHAFTFRLARAEPIRGTVRNPDGSPARDGFVYLVPPHREGWIDYLSLENDGIDDRTRPRTVHAKVGADGRFSLPPRRENFALLALADAGSVLVPRRDLHGDDVLRLQPWARVNGTVTIDGKPAANLALQSHDPDDSAPVEGEPRLVRQHYVKTDADGRFELPRVMPGRLTLAQWVPNGVNRRVWPVVRATVDAEAGRSYELKVGNSGRLVTGRLVLPATDTWMIRKAEIVRKEEKTDRPAAIGVELLGGGRFRALDLAPGDYALRIALHEPPPANACGWGRLLGEYAHDFRVPAGTAASEAPVELGTLEPSEVGGRPLQVGDRAPDFRIKTLEGKDLALADFRGKYVLLDFWASWCAPCLAEMPNLRAVHDEFARDPRFALVGVSLDDRPRNAEPSVKSLKLAWPQGFAGPESPVVSAYGATAIPATFLIGPDGTIVARDLRGEKTRAAVVEALKP